MLIGNILRKYGLVKAVNREFAFSAKAMRANENRPTSLQYSRKKQCNIISTVKEEKITRFYERDVNSGATTGKKDTQGKEAEAHLVWHNSETVSDF